MTGLLFWFSVLMILYVYAGYPLAVAVLARLFPRPVKSGDQKPTVTLLIAAYNEGAVIEEKINNSLLLDYPAEKLQIIVAADGSTDRTVEIVKRYAGRGVELCYKPERRGKMAAINRAMQHAAGEIVLFSDANNHYGTDVLDRLVRPFADPAVGAVSGSKHIRTGLSNVGDSEGLYWKYESFIKEQESRFGSCTGVTGEIFAIRRTLFAAPPEKIINDDFYILMHILRKGYRVVYEPLAVSLEEASHSAGDEITRRTRIIAGRYQAMSMAVGLMPWDKPVLVWQLISHKFLRPLVPFFMLFALFFNLAAVLAPAAGETAGWLWLSQPYGYLLLSLQALFYLAAFLGRTIQGKTPLQKVLFFPSFLVNSNFAALAGFYRYLTGKQPVAWEKVNRQRKAVAK